MSFLQCEIVHYKGFISVMSTEALLSSWVEDHQEDKEIKDRDRKLRSRGSLSPDGQKRLLIHCNVFICTFAMKRPFA